jgi:hypothetical protein
MFFAMAAVIEALLEKTCAQSSRAAKSALIDLQVEISSGISLTTFFKVKIPLGIEMAVPFLRSAIPDSIWTSIPLALWMHPSIPWRFSALTKP